MVLDHEEPASLAVGAAMGPAGSGASAFGSGFVEPMSEDSLGMCYGPAVGQHLVQPRIVRMQPKEQFAYVVSVAEGCFFVPERS